MSFLPSQYHCGLIVALWSVQDIWHNQKAFAGKSGLLGIYHFWV